jgi:hypothetical protein
MDLKFLIFQYQIINYLETLNFNLINNKHLILIDNI